MALVQPLDITDAFNLEGGFIQDVSGWDFTVVQLVTPAGAVNFLASNDSGAVQGVTDGDSSTAINFTAVQGTNLATGAAATSLNASGLMRFPVVGRYLQLTGTTAAKILLLMHKIS